MDNIIDNTDPPWDVRLNGREWSTEKEILNRNSIIPSCAKIEIHNGKLCFNDSERLTLLAMLLENLGLNTAVENIDALRELYGEYLIHEDEESRDSTLEEKHGEPDHELSSGQIKKLKNRIENFESPIRYVVYSRVLKTPKHYLNIEDGSYCDDLECATVFKDFSTACAVANESEGIPKLIAQISIQGESRQILADTCLQPARKRPFTETLADIPNVGVDEDFERIQDRSILRITGDSSCVRLLLQNGGVMTAIEAADWLGIEIPELRKLRDDGELITVLFIESDLDYYPAFQFTRDGELVYYYSNILKGLEANSPIDAIRFFLTPDQMLNGMTPIEALTENNNPTKQLLRVTHLMNQYRSHRFSHD